MNVRKMAKEDLELLSFSDIAYNIIKLDKAPKTTVDIFKEICKLLDLSKKEYEEKIADFFTSLIVDKRFILLENINWDLKENHSIKTIIDDSEDEFEDIEEEIEEADAILTEKDDISPFVEEDDLDVIDEEDIEEDEMEDLEIIDEVEEEPEEE